ncbi:MAG: hypothetical protein NTV75_00995 [Bacteroidia bacterium]|nr:hypothetical protein [Bacteroidia bacterium]
MTERETALLREFKEKLDKLIGLYQQVNKEKELLLEEKSKLMIRLDELSLKNDELARKSEDLKFTKTLLGADDDSHEAKLKLNKIVREIDNCIALLNK